MLKRMKIQDLNPHLTCVLCKGYMVDATAIVECLHSFCRSCIVKYLYSSFHCPVCDVEVHKTRPLLHIRPDRTLQDIVNKLVPGLNYGEIKRRKQFEENLNNPQKDGQASTDGDGDKKAFSTSNNNESKEEIYLEDPVCITMEYYRQNRRWMAMEKQIFPTRYLRCPSAVTVSVLKKFLVTKFSIPDSHEVEIIRSDEIIDEHLTMKDVSRIYGLFSKRFLDLQYIFLEVPSHTPREKSEHIQSTLKKLEKETKARPVRIEVAASKDNPITPGDGGENLNFSTPTTDSTVNTKETGGPDSPELPGVSPTFEHSPCYREFQSVR